MFKQLLLIEVSMRGDDGFQDELFTYGGLGERVPLLHPLRRIRVLADDALRCLSAEFDQMYSKIGRPSIPPEQMLRALLLQLLYSVRSERMLVEQLEYNLLFRWFVGLPLSAPAWDATSFTKNRERLLAGDVSQHFFTAVVQQAKRNRLLHDEQFTVDGTLIEAWASEKSYREKPGPPPSKGTGSKGEMLKSDLYESVTDPDARMYRKGLKTGWKLQHMAHAVSENEHGLVVATSVSTCSPRAERMAAITMMKRLKQVFRPRIVAADKGYHDQEFVEQMQRIGVESHVPPYRAGRRSCMDSALYERPDYVASQKKRKWIERFFSWLKTTAGLRKTRHRGHPKLNWNFALAAAAYNLTRMAHLLA
jgi:transposase